MQLPNSPRCLSFSIACALVAAITASCGAMMVTGPSFANLQIAPYINIQPAPEIGRYEGEYLQLSCQAIGNPTPTLQWRKNGINLPGATASQYTIPSAQLHDAGSYTLAAANKYGTATSLATVVTVTAISVPTVTRHPASQTLTFGDRAAFVVSAEGAPAPTFQWRRDGAVIAGATNSTLNLARLSPSDEGAYDVIVRNSAGSVVSAPAVLTVLTLRTAILRQPAHTSVEPGRNAALFVTTVGANLTYQWKKGGVPLPGATAAIFTLTSAQASDMGFYSVFISGSNGTVESAIAILTITTPGNSRLANISTLGRLPVGGTLASGFAWRGAEPMRVLVRAVGPTLGAFGVGAALSNPRVDLTATGGTTVFVENDDWSTSERAAGIAAATTSTGAFPLEPGSKDAVLLTELAADGPRNYSARITSADREAGGAVLAEIYDAGRSDATSRLTDVTILGENGPDAPLTAGFTITGTAPKQLMLRAVGPGLNQFRVANPIADPRLAIYANGLEAPVASNDDWGDDAKIISAGIIARAFDLPARSKDAALIVTLPPGGYTVSVTNASGAAGAVLLEVHDTEP